MNNSRGDDILAGEELDVGHGFLVAAKHADRLPRLPQVVVVDTVVCQQKASRRSTIIYHCHSIKTQRAF